MSLTVPSLPFNARLLTDSNYTDSASLSAPALKSFNFEQATPFPTLTDKVDFVATLYVQAANSASLYVQHSSDNSTWSNVSQLAAPILTVATSANQVKGQLSASFKLEPDTKQYVRLSSSFAGTAGADNYGFVANM